MNKKVLFVIAQEGFQEIEYGVPRRILEEAGAKITIASFERGAGVGANGLIVRTEIGVDDVNVKDFDAVVFIGGGGMVPLVGDIRFVNLAKKFNDAEKIVSAICIAPMILANAGLLEGKNATVTSGVVEKLKSKGANFEDRKVVVDGRFITASGPSAAEDFGKALADALP